MRRLIINGSPADLSNEPIGLTWQYFDVSDPSKRYNPFSSTIKLPFTPRNLSIMGYANATGARLTAARSLPNVDYYFGPMKVIEGGTLKVTSIEKDTITCSITSKNSLQNDLHPGQWMMSLLLPLTRGRTPTLTSWPHLWPVPMAGCFREQ